MPQPAHLDARLTLGRNTAYDLMGAGLHGINRINLSTSLNTYKVYVLPRVLYDLETIFINPTNLKRLEVAHRAITEYSRPTKENSHSSIVHPK